MRTRERVLAALRAPGVPGFGGEGDSVGCRSVWAARIGRVFEVRSWAFGSVTSRVTVYNTAEKAADAWADEVGRMALAQTLFGWLP